MYNPDFWEVRLDPADLDRFPAEAAIWHQAGGEEARRRGHGEARAGRLLAPVMDLIWRVLTERQRQALLLYYLHGKTQEEVAQIMGISRRVVSQHLFGIRRNGRQVGGAIARLRQSCRQQGLAGHP